MNPLGEKRLGAADLGGARQERQHRTGVGAQRRGDRVRHLPFDRGVGLAPEIARLDRERAPFAFDHGRVAEQPCHPRAVKRRRHHQNAQVLPQALLRVARQRQPEIGIQRAFVELVEQHRGHAGEFGIIENLPREDAFGHHLDAGLA